MEWFNDGPLVIEVIWDTSLCYSEWYSYVVIPYGQYYYQSYDN
jgi:hypothetical protein